MFSWSVLKHGLIAYFIVVLTIMVITRDDAPILLPVSGIRINTRVVQSTRKIHADMHDITTQIPVVS